MSNPCPRLGPALCLLIVALLDVYAPLPPGRRARSRVNRVDIFEAAFRASLSREGVKCARNAHDFGFENVLHCPSLAI